MPGRIRSFEDTQTYHFSLTIPLIPKKPNCHVISRGEQENKMATCSLHNNSYSRTDLHSRGAPNADQNCSAVQSWSSPEKFLLFRFRFSVGSLNLFVSYQAHLLILSEFVLLLECTFLEFLSNRFIIVLSPKQQPHLCCALSQSISQTGRSFRQWVEYCYRIVKLPVPKSTWFSISTQTLRQSSPCFISHPFQCCSSISCVYVWIYNLYCFPIRNFCARFN